MKSENKLGRVYRCPVCGAELSVIHRGRGCLAPVCCNVEMQLEETVVNQVYHCPSCGSELMVIVSGSGNVEPYCCNKPMILINA